MREACAGPPRLTMRLTRLQCLRRHPPPQRRISRWRLSSSCWRWGFVDEAANRRALSRRRGADVQMALAMLFE